MDYESYMQLYEAVYFFDRINCCIDQDEIKEFGLNESIYKAIIRILVVNDLLYFDGSSFVMTDEHKARHRYILDNIINKTQNKHYADMFNKAVNSSQFFFDSISELEYEIYSRYNFHITFEIGKEVVKHIDFAKKKVLELGGNSGGLATSILTGCNNCSYTIVDTKIPCTVGNEFKASNEVNIIFIEGNVFELSLPSEICDYIIIMNLLHDFDDIKCLNILRNCIKHCDCNTKFLIIEDILTDEFEPKEVIMNGLRLAVECRGGRQRTLKELQDLFSNIGYKSEKIVRLNNIQTMLIMSQKNA